MGSEQVTVTPESAVLLSISCTTGWADWVHGELWLLSDGLARFSLGLGTSAVNANLPGSLGIGILKHLSPEELAERAATNKRNFVIRAEEVDLAELRRGIITGRLRLHLSDGTSRKLLWKRTNKTLQPLAGALGEWLGDRLIKA